MTWRLRTNRRSRGQIGDRTARCRHGRRDVGAPHDGHPGDRLLVGSRGSGAVSRWAARNRRPSPSSARVLRAGASARCPSIQDPPRSFGRAPRWDSLPGSQFERCAPDRCRRPRLRPLARSSSSSRRSRMMSPRADEGSGYSTGQQPRRSTPKSPCVFAWASVGLVFVLALTLAPSADARSSYAQVGYFGNASSGNSPAQGEFRQPQRVAVAPPDASGAGDIYVADTGNHRIEVFTPAAPGPCGSACATFLTEFGAGELSEPVGVAVDPATGAVYVMDAGLGEVVEYDRTSGSPPTFTKDTGFKSPPLGTGAGLVGCFGAPCSSSAIISAASRSTPTSILSRARMTSCSPIPARRRERSSASPRRAIPSKNGTARARAKPSASRPTLRSTRTAM